jgi:LacI family transcriptional regulator
MSAADTVSIYQLADRLGVSATTVSRVLNHRKGIGNETRHRVWAAAREAGYRPKQSVRRMTIGLLVDHVNEDAMGSFVPRLTTNVMAELAHHDLTLEVFSRGNLKAMTRRYLDGILAIAWEPDTIAALKTVKGVPIVIFNRSEDAAFSQVCSDFHAGGRQVAQLLLDHGHRRIGYLSQKFDMPVEQMITGFSERLAEAGCPLPPQAIAYTLVQPPYASVKRLIDQGITALWVCHPDLSYEVPYLCGELMGLKLPGDLSIVGLDDSVRHTYSRPPMTVATENVERLISEALQMLMAQVNEHDAAPRRAMVPMDVIVRESLQDIH